jgi:hypothetical protein
MLECESIRQSCTYCDQYMVVIGSSSLCWLRRLCQDHIRKYIAGEQGTIVQGMLMNVY